MAIQTEGKGKELTICLELLVNIMQELRKDRKIRMTIADKNVEEYIMLNLEDLPPENEQSAFLKKVLKNKVDQRRDMLIQVS